MIKPLPKKDFLSPFRPEANIIINNTKNIKEVFWDKDKCENEGENP